jgi:hypothetical protein
VNSYEFIPFRYKVRIAIRLWVRRWENRGSIPGSGRNFLFAIDFRQALGAHSASEPVWTRVFSPGAKQPECKAKYPRLFITKIK